MMNSSAPAIPRWYACYTRSRHEKRVDERLRRQGLEVFLPTVIRVRQWHDRQKAVEWPLFPSYVFARFGLDRLSRVLETPGVTTIVRFNGTPVAIPEQEIENVRRLAEGLSKADTDPEPAPLVETGQRVRISSGPLEDVRGIVSEHRGRDRLLITVGLQSIRQGMKVEVDADLVELLDEHEA